MTAQTVGEIALNLLAQSTDSQPDAIELQQSIHAGENSRKTYEEEIWEAADRGVGDEAITGDFFIVVLFRREKLLPTVVRQQFFYRQSCPSPDYDQTVYKFYRKSEEIEYLWTVPSREGCAWIRSSQHELPKEQEQLISMVNAFYAGDLDLYAQKLNKETVKDGAVLTVIKDS